jgi:hypothetical protein
VSAERIALVENLTLRYFAHPQREEIEFIGAVLYTREARDCKGDAPAGSCAKKA